MVEADLYRALSIIGNSFALLGLRNDEYFEFIKLKLMRRYEERIVAKKSESEDSSENEDEDDDEDEPIPLEE
jgi:hypothetical protein